MLLASNMFAVKDENADSFVLYFGSNVTKTSAECDSNSKHNEEAPEVSLLGVLHHPDVSHTMGQYLHQKDLQSLAATCSSAASSVRGYRQVALSCVKFDFTKTTILGFESFLATSLSLKELTLEHATDEHLEKINNAKEKLQNLTTLKLIRCSITDAGLSHLKGMPLNSLDISWCYITDAGLGYLRGMPLDKLDLSYCVRITDAGLEHLKGMPLNSLDHFGCNNITNAGLEPFEGILRR